jgi:hypothetical protein
MIFNEESIKTLINQVLTDLKLSYFEDKEFIIRYDEDDEDAKEYGIKKPWLCFVEAHNWQFDTNEGIYSFHIDDNEPHDILLIDGSGGRTPFFIIKKDNNNKYYRAEIAEKS